jgi:pyrimidine-nucleoside phosphorylase
LRAVDVIERKRDGLELSPEEIDLFVSRYSRGEIPDYQAAALAMAVFLRGMSPAETLALTRAMRDSGEVLDLSTIPGPKVDKHSTGGVGDKTSLILAPLAAACGVVVPMISGRGLGHTGGTLDKLESIPGFRTDLTLGQLRSVLEQCGVALVGQTPEIAPADRRLYALRDVTATVESLPLIAASIMSKKMAEGISALVLDVKTGDGAFLPDAADARALAQAMIDIGRGLGCRVTALLTDMEQPLGRGLGNALEVAECLEVLRGEGPPDTRALSVELAARMVHLGGLETSLEAARERVGRALEGGHGLARFRRVVELQGGDPRICDEPGRLPRSRDRIELRAERRGFVTRLACRAVGRAIMLLGAGRETVDGTIDAAVGLVLHKKVGDPVEMGEPFLTAHVNDRRRLDEALGILASALEIDEGPPPAAPLVREVAT